MKRSTYILNFVITLIIIGLVFYFIGIEKTIEELFKVDIFYLSLAIIVYILLNILMSLRIKKLLNSMNQKINLTDTIKANFAGMLMSDITPVRSGYFFTAFAISSEKKIALDKTILSIFGPQIFEFLLKAICSAILVVVVLGSLFQNQNELTLLLIIVTIVGLVCVLALLFSRKLLTKFSFMRKIPGIKKLFFLMELMQINSRILLKEWRYVFGVLMGAWILKGIEWFLIAKALGIELIGVNEIDFFLIFHSAITFLHFVPFPTIAGAGPSEAISAGILNLLGVPIEKALAFAIITRGLMIAVDAIVGSQTITKFIRKGNFFDLMNQIDKKQEK